MDCSPLGFSLCGILQTRILEWVAISFSRGSSSSKDQTHISYWQADSLPLSHLGSPLKGVPGTQMNPVLMGLSVLSLPLLTPSPLKPSISFSSLSCLYLSSTGPFALLNFFFSLAFSFRVFPIVMTEFNLNLPNNNHVQHICMVYLPSLYLLCHVLKLGCLLSYLEFLCLCLFLSIDTSIDRHTYI